MNSNTNGNGGKTSKKDGGDENENGNCNGNVHSNEHMNENPVATDKHSNRIRPIDPAPHSQENIPAQPQPPTPSSTPTVHPPTPFRKRIAPSNGMMSAEDVEFRLRSSSSRFFYAYVTF